MDLQHLRASDGTGEAVLAHIQTPRTVGSTVLDVDNVDNWPQTFTFVTGTPAANGFISPSGMKVMYGHLSAGDIIIDGYAPGYSDNGNTTSEVAIVKMTTSWADALVNLLGQAHQDDGKLKVTSLDDFYKPSEMVFDHVASGCVLTGTGYGSTLAWSLTAGVVYINGLRYTVAAATGSVTASKDTYFDILMPVSGNVATLVNTGGNIVNNNAASPALAANSIRIGIIQSGANIASIAAINQGQVGKVLPIASSQPYMVTDSLGNLICPRDPQRKILGYREITADVTTASTSNTLITGLFVPYIVPGDVPRNVEFELFTCGANHTAAGGYFNINISNGSISGATNVIAGSTLQSINGSSSIFPMSAKRVRTQNSGANSATAGFYSITAGTTRFGAAAEGTGEHTPSYLIVKQA